MPKRTEQLIADYLSGNIAEADVAALLHLLREDKQAEQLFRNMAKTRALSAAPGFEVEKKSNYKYLLSKIQPSKSKSRVIYFRNFYKVAAVLILLIASNLLLHFYIQPGSDKDSIAYYETEVPYGSLSKVILPDKTCVWLNAGSSLRYAQVFGNKKREVYLKGEAYFRVTKDAARPFYVHSERLDVCVLGTTFNMRAYANESVVKVDLIEGKVNVNASNGKQNKQLILYPNQEATFNKENCRLAKNDINAEKSSLWITGKLCFIDDSFQSIAVILERKYDVRVINESAKLRIERFSGSFDTNCTIDEILTDIDVDHKYSWTRLRNVIKIKDK